MPRIQLEAAGLEFEEGGNTIWVHGMHGTMLRIKCTGRVTAKSCSAPGAHADVIVDGNIEFCVPAEGEEPVDVRASANQTRLVDRFLTSVKVDPGAP